MQPTVVVVTLTIAACLAGEPRTVRQTEAVDWWQKTVFYQIYPRSFKDSDGDGVGDLQGIIEKLPHLADLGVGATWLSPIMKSPMVDFGYDVEDFLEIDETFGTMADFDELMAVANELGIKIIMDFVPNHTSNQHDWFIKSELKEDGFEDFYIWHPGKIVDGVRHPPNNWMAVFRGKAWEWSDIREEYYYHQFAVEQPDLNYRNPAVMEEMKEVFRFWMGKGVAGFRIDAINHLMEYQHLKDEPRNPDVDDEESYSYVFHDYTLDLPETYDFVYEFRKVMDDWTTENQTETKILMSEAYTSVPNVMRYYVSDDGRKIGSHFAFNFMLINDVGPDTNAEGYKTIVLDRWFDALPEGRTSNWVLGNHDRPRIASRYGSERVSALLTLEMTLPGVAITYYGEEIGMLDHRDISWSDTIDPQACNSNEELYQALSRDPQRTPMQWDASANAGFSTTTNKTWLPVHPGYGSNNLADQKLRQGRTYSLYKQLVALRSQPAFWSGDFTYTALSENVLAYTRSLAGNESYTVVINFGGATEKVDLCPLIPSCSSRARTSIGEIVAKFKQFEVVVSGMESKYKEGDMIINGFTLDAYDALVLKSGAIRLSTSICLTVLLVLFKFFWHM